MRWLELNRSNTNHPVRVVIADEKILVLEDGEDFPITECHVGTLR